MKKLLGLGIIFLLVTHECFSQLPSDGQNQEPEPAAAALNDYLIPMLVIAVFVAGYFFRSHNKELKIKIDETKN